MEAGIGRLCVGKRKEIAFYSYPCEYVLGVMGLVFELLIYRLILKIYKILLYYIR